MTDQVLSSVVLILACFLVYQAVIRSSAPRSDDHKAPE